MIHVGKALRAIRTAKMMTQADVAKAAKISYSHLSAIENGHRDFTFDVFYAICDALVVKPSTVMLIGDTDAKELVPYAAAQLAKRL